jgi:hypothetical protein
MCPAAISPQLYLQLVRDGNKPPGESSFLFHLHRSGGLHRAPKSTKRSKFADIKKNKVDYRERVCNDGYVAMVQHYFASAWMLARWRETQLSMSIKRDIGSTGGRLLLPVHDDHAPGDPLRQAPAKLSTPSSLPAHRKKNRWKNWRLAWSWSRTTVG